MAWSLPPGNTWEAAYAWWEGGIPAIWAYGRALPDIFKYAIARSGGLLPSDLNVDLYAENNWTNNARPTVYKHRGDVLDIVAVVRNSTGQAQQNVTLTLELPRASFRTDLLAVFKRSAAEELALNDLAVVPHSVDLSGSSMTITLDNLTIEPDAPYQWNDYVFRLAIATGAPLGAIDATATITDAGGGSAVSTLGSYMNHGEPAVSVINNGRLIMTNQRSLYRTYVARSGAIDRAQATAINNLGLPCIAWRRRSAG